MTLYNCKSAHDFYRITKFDSNFEVEASYLTSLSECDCPAGQRPTCRHRKMLPRFLTKKATEGQYFYNYEHNKWVEAKAETLGDLECRVDEPESVIEPSTQNITATEIDERIANLQAPSNAMIEATVNRSFSLLDLAKIPGITVVSLDNPATLHNTIAEAVGEPTIPDKPKPLRRI